MATTDAIEIVTRGQRGFRLLGIDDTSNPYLVGEIEYLPDEPAADSDEIKVLVVVTPTPTRTKSRRWWPRRAGRRRTP